MGPILKRIGIGVGLATVVVIAVGFLLPRQYEVTRTVAIKAPTAAIHPLVDDLERWPEWTPWAKSDPTIRITYGPVTAGVGAHQSWTGDSGGGELTLTRSDPDWGIAYDMSFQEGKYPSVSTMTYRAADGGGTEVAWTMTGDTGVNPFGRFFGLMMDPMVGPMFEDGLNRLKLLAEKEAAALEETVPAAPDTAP
jgi:hypothetical protein